MPLTRLMYVLSVLTTLFAGVLWYPGPRLLPVWCRHPRFSTLSRSQYLTLLGHKGPGVQRALGSTNPSTGSTSATSRSPWFHER